MGLVTDIFWECPKCSTINKAQVYGEWSDPESFPRDAVPMRRELKWNPPCTKCGKYELQNPSEILVEFPIKEAN